MGIEDSAKFGEDKIMPPAGNLKELVGGRVMFIEGLIEARHLTLHGAGFIPSG